MPKVELEIPTPRWALPLLRPARYKGLKGGRSSGKSHDRAEAIVEDMVMDADLRCVCVREVQRSLRYSAKSLIEAKIRQWGLEGSLFKILSTEIRRIGGDGVCIFEGMQDHTADSLKSLEGFGRAWVEEAQNLSQRSLDLLLPTIRAEGSEVWFSWNPQDPTDPVDEFFASLTPADEHVLVHVNYTDNPFCPAEAKAEAERMQRLDPDNYAHIWLGEYATRSDAVVLSGRWRVDEFEPAASWDGPYLGADWGFSQDPTVLVRCWIADGRLWIDYSPGAVGILTTKIGELIFDQVPGSREHKIRADAARPETIAELVSQGYRCEAAPKWSGSVEDGVAYLLGFEEIVIHERAKRAQDEARLWRYKTDRLTGDPLPKLEDAHNHVWDAVRYALSPLIRRSTRKEPRVYYAGMEGAA